MSDIVERVKVALGYLPAIEPHRSLLAECKAEITRLRAQVAAADNPVATIIKRIKPDGSSSIKPELHVGVDLPIGTYLYVSPPAASSHELTSVFGSINPAPDASPSREPSPSASFMVGLAAPPAASPTVAPQDEPAAPTLRDYDKAIESAGWWGNVNGEGGWIGTPSARELFELGWRAALSPDRGGK